MSNESWDSDVDELLEELTELQKKLADRAAAYDAYHAEQLKNDENAEERYGEELTRVRQEIGRLDSLPSPLQTAKRQVETALAALSEHVEKARSAMKEAESTLDDTSEPDCL